MDSSVSAGRIIIIICTIPYLVLSALDFKGVPEVSGEIGYEEKHDDIPPRLSLLVEVGVTAPPEAVNDH